MPKPNPCPVCDTGHYAHRQLMCECCWSLVPAALQQAVYDTWRRARSAPSGSLHRLRATEYARARTDAITAAQGALRPANHPKDRHGHA